MTTLQSAGDAASAAAQTATGKKGNSGGRAHAPRPATRGGHVAKGVAGQRHNMPGGPARHGRRPGTHAGTCRPGNGPIPIQYGSIHA